jgi:2-methylcitrate dehydratase PrpD
MSTSSRLDFGAPRLQGEEGFSFKPYPCCRSTHSAIEATLKIIEEHKIKPGDVDTITVGINVGGFKSLCDPLDIKRNPRTMVDAQFSIPWTVAVALVRGKVDMDGFGEETIKDKTILAFSNKVVPRVDKSLCDAVITPAIVEIKTKDSGVYSHQVRDIYGSPQNPMGMDGLAEKFRDCASHGVKSAKRERLEKLIQLLYRFETIRNLKEVIRLLDWSK